MTRSRAGRAGLSERVTSRVRVLTFVPTVVSADYDLVTLCAHYLIIMTGGPFVLTGYDS